MMPAAVSAASRWVGTLREIRGSPEREIAAGLAAGIALDDGVAALYEDEQLVEIVSARPEGRALRVDAEGERPLPVRHIA